MGLDARGARRAEKGYQVKHDSVVGSVPPGSAKALKLAPIFRLLFFFGAMFGYGLFQTIYNWNQTSPAIGLVMSIPYAALPVGFFIMFFLMLEEFLSFIGAGTKGEAE
jgi:TRAP-type C4-dicarboxylate transport system permease small subunit